MMAFHVRYERASAAPRDQGPLLRVVNPDQTRQFGRNTQQVPADEMHAVAKRADLRER